MTSSVRKIDATSVEVAVELNAADLAAYVHEAEQALASRLNIDGFRAGKIPLDVVRKHVSEQQIREEGLEIAVRKSLQAVVQEHKLDILDQEKFSIKENTPEKFTYHVTLILYPTVVLGPYKELSVTKQPISVADTELDVVLKEIAQSRKKDDIVPELNDEFAKSLGSFSSLDDLKAQIRVGLTQEKEMKEEERIRTELLKLIVAASKIAVPGRMIETQLDAMMQSLDGRLHAQGMELGPYLAHMKKTQEELRKEWRAQAETQVKMLLAMHEIAKAEQIVVTDQEAQEVLEAELQSFLAGRQHMTPEDLQKIDTERLKSKIYSDLLNKKVFEFLQSHAILKE